MVTRRTPAALEAAGKRLWRTVVAEVDGAGMELRADELRVLEDACRAADTAERCAAGLVGESLTVPGARGQLVAHPLISEELRARSLTARLLAQLGLGRPPAQPETARTRNARRAANARWSGAGNPGVA
jgi:P27 family predicted phage terminase small subunit